MHRLLCQTAADAGKTVSEQQVCIPRTSEEHSHYRLDDKSTKALFTSHELN